MAARGAGTRVMYMKGMRAASIIITGLIKVLEFDLKRVIIALSCQLLFSASCMYDWLCSVLWLLPAEGLAPVLNL
jgi:hypothetical protein